MPPLRRSVLTLVLLLSMPVSGCGREEEEPLPAACRQGEGAIRAALRSAPATVTVDGVPLSGCLTPDSDSGDVQEVGTAFLGVAAELSAKAEAQPESSAAVQLGYLIGAVHRGTDESQGIHSELVRRLEGEVGTLDTRSEAFRDGDAAGRLGG